MTDAYRSFFKNFGSAYRTKHIRLQWANPALRIFGKGPKRTVRAVQRNNRPYHLPWRGPLPKEFIRLDPWEGQYVFLISSMAKRGILEIGRFNGGSLFLMACANPAVPIYSIDIAPQDDACLREIFRTQGVGANVKLIVGDSQRERSPEVGSFDVLFVDETTPMMDAPATSRIGSRCSSEAVTSCCTTATKEARCSRRSSISSAGTRSESSSLPTFLRSTGISHSARSCT
jgi:hypothetical protein